MLQHIDVRPAPIDVATALAFHPYFEGAPLVPLSRLGKMSLRSLPGLAAGCLIAGTALAQTPPPPSQPRAVTRTMYTRNTELFAEWRPLVVGEATRLTAHLTRTGDRFRPYTEGNVTLTLAVAGEIVKVMADGPERPGVFRLNVTPTKAGPGRVVIDVASSAGPQRFVFDDVPVYATVQAALAAETPEEPGLVSYAKERSWEEDFATAPVTVYFPGAGSIVTVPAMAIVRDGETARVFVQRTPERFELREVKTRRIFGEAIEITSGLRSGERIVIRGVDKMPRQ